MPNIYRIGDVWIFCWRIPNGWPGGGMMHFGRSSLVALLRIIPRGVVTHFRKSLHNDGGMK